MSCSDGFGFVLQQADRGHDHAGRAVAALERFGLEKRLLHRVEPVAIRERLDRRDGLGADAARRG